MAESIREIAQRMRAIVQAGFWEPEDQSSENSVKQGKKLRKDIPLKAHGMWKPTDDRLNPVELLKSQNESRVQELLPVRYERMSASPFTFFRGSAIIMASDLSTTATTGIEVQVCGDAHISNFGLFLSPERRTVFDINDFDETARGPWEWDVKRLATSVEICARERGFKKDDCKDVVRACVKSYRKTMERFADIGHLDVWYSHFDADALLAQFSGRLSKQERKQAEKTLDKSKAKNSTRAISKLTEVVDGELRIVSDPPIVVPLRDWVEKSNFGNMANVDVEHFVHMVLAEYYDTLPPEKRWLMEQYRGVDMARKVVGVGSVGTRAYIVVMQGADAHDPLVLQIKEAQESVVERFWGKGGPRQHGRRVVEGQRAMQTASDMLLGWCCLPGNDGRFHDYYVRQLWDGKGSINLSRIDLDHLRQLGQACGATLAHAHARTGDRFKIFGYLGDDSKFDKAIVKFAHAYADQNERDYDEFMAAFKAGKLV